MKQLLLSILLSASFSAQASELSPSEFSCLTLSVYLEGRSLSPEGWVKIGAVALNRSRDWHNYHYGAVSPNICDIVSSKEYTSYKLLHKPIKEKEVFNKISFHLMKAFCFSEFTAWDKLFYFSSSRGVMRFRETYKGTHPTTLNPHVH